MRARRVRRTPKPGRADAQTRLASFGAAAPQAVFAAKKAPDEERPGDRVLAARPRVRAGGGGWPIPMANPLHAVQVPARDVQAGDWSPRVRNVSSGPGPDGSPSRTATVRSAPGRGGGAQARGSRGPSMAARSTPARSQITPLACLITTRLVSAPTAARAGAGPRRWRDAGRWTGRPGRRRHGRRSRPPRLRAGAGPGRARGCQHRRGGQSHCRPEQPGGCFRIMVSPSESATSGPQESARFLIACVRAGGQELKCAIAGAQPTP